MKARCYECGTKPARRLNLQDAFGKEAVFCSLKCAALCAIEPFLCGAQRWCELCNQWLGEIEQCPHGA